MDGAGRPVSRSAGTTRTLIPRLAPAVDRDQGHTGYNGGYLQARWTRSSSAESESVVQFSYDGSKIHYPWLDADLHNLTFDFQKRTQTGETE